MSKENMVRYLEAAAADEQLMQQLQSTSSYEDLKNLAREQGFDLGDLGAEEAGRIVGVVTGEISEELSDEELEMVAGGWSHEVVSPRFYEGWPVSGLKRGKAT